MRAVFLFTRSPCSCFWSSRQGSMAVSETMNAPEASNGSPLSAHEGAPESARERAAQYVVSRHRFRPAEALPWLLAIAAYFIFPDRMTFGSQVAIMIMFALSLDLILGYAGIVTLGHAAFFGIGAYTVALMVVRFGWTEPISGLFAAAILTGIFGFVLGWFTLRYRGLT